MSDSNEVLAKMQALMGKKPQEESSAPQVETPLADPTPEPEVRPEPPKEISLTVLRNRIAAIKEHVFQFRGKPGYNPHLWIAQHLASHEKLVKTGRISQRQAQEVMDLPTKPDCSVEMEPTKNRFIEDESKI